MENDFGDDGMFHVLPLLPSADRNLYAANVSIYNGSLACLPAFSPDVRNYDCGIVSEAVAVVCLSVPHSVRESSVVEKGRPTCSRRRTSTAPSVRCRAW